MDSCRLGLAPPGPDLSVHDLVRELEEVEGVETAEVDGLSVLVSGFAFSDLDLVLAARSLGWDVTSYEPA